MTDTTVLPTRTVSLLGGLRREGHFSAGTRATHLALIGGMALDLREADLTPGGLAITKISLIGGVRVVVPPGFRLDVGGFTLFGGKDVERDAGTPPDAPVVKVRAYGLVGGVRVRTSR